MKDVNGMEMKTRKMVRTKIRHLPDPMTIFQLGFSGETEKSLGMERMDGQKQASVP